MVSRNFVIFPPSAVKDPTTMSSQGLKVKKNGTGAIAILSEEGNPPLSLSGKTV
jgi:hypothetical protein